MNWFTLWLMWLSKTSSFWEVVLQQQTAAPKEPEPRGSPKTAPPRPDAAPKRQEAAPPSLWITPAAQHKAPPQQAMSSPPREPASLRQAVAPAPQEIAPKRRETAPPSPEVIPPPPEVAPASQQTVGKHREFAQTPPEQPKVPQPRPEVSPQATTLPPQAKAPHPPETAPPPQAMAPAPSGVTPSALEEIARKLEEIAQKREKVASSQPEPPLEEIAPRLEEIAPRLEEIAPPLEEIALPLEEIAPKLHEQMPPPRETASNPQEAASERQTFAQEGTGEGSMMWRKRPMIYEIPTWVWLNEMRARHGAGVTLGTIPAAEWDALAELDIDAVWLMGVWERSPAGIAVSNANSEQQGEFQRALPDYTPADNVGSAYCVRDYVVAEHLGGPAALAQARAALNARGLRLILDFVPNHVAIDHPWASHHPDYFVRGTSEDLARAPSEFVSVSGNVLANGRDPYFAPWRDVLQLNAFHTQLRAAAVATVSSIAAQCDGLRCDMAMLLLNDIFQRTWGDRAGEKPATEYWQDVIPAVKAKYPNTLFIAEVYWDLEYEMMQKGFDYCYDKRLYDRLVGDNAESIRAHLTAGLDYQDRLVRFIENHDEPRAAATFYGAKERAAAIVMATTPGAKLVYDGQLEGRQVKLPVFLARRRPETPDNELALFYRSLLTALHADLFHEGEWHLCERSGWPNNGSFHDIVAWTWRYRDHRTLIVVNLSAHRAQAMVHLPWDDLRGQTWRLVETLAWECYVRDGDDLANAGLFVDLDAWGFHFLKFE